MARSTLCSRSRSSATVAVATYGISCAIAISGDVLALAEHVARLRPDRLGRGGARGRRGGPRPLDAGVHVALVVVADVEHVVAALEHAGQAPKPMSTVPPSPPWPITRTSSRPLALSAAATPGGHGRRVAEEGVDPGQLPRRLGERRREDLEAAGGVGGDQVAAGRAHGGVQRVAGAERLAAALAGAVARGERVRAVHARLHRPLLGSEQAVAGHEGARLVELDLAGRASFSSAIRRPPMPRSLRMFSACGPGRLPAAWRFSSRSTSSGRGRGR